MKEHYPFVTHLSEGRRLSIESTDLCAMDSLHYDPALVSRVFSGEGEQFVVLQQVGDTQRLLCALMLFQNCSKTLS